MNHRTNRIRSITGLLLLVVVTTAAQAQDEIKRPPLRVPEIADTALQLVPSGWRFDEAPSEVDLNGDGKPDDAFVISHGGIAEPGNGELAVVKHVLVLALRGTDGKLHRSIVSDAAVLDGDEGGAFGDPFDSLAIEHGTVTIAHYGGSRERWNYTHKYRYRGGQWMLTGLAFGTTDSTDTENYENHEINLLTGLAEANRKGDPTGGSKRKREIAGSYYELQALPVDQAPIIDGNDALGEWPGYLVQLNERSQVYRNRKLWRGPEDVSARLQAVRSGKDLFVLAKVPDNEVTPGDVVRLVTRKGLVIKPLESKIKLSGKGYVFEAKYSLETVVRASQPGDKYALEALQQRINLSGGGGDLEGFELPVSVEIVDVDRSGVPKMRSVLSTRLAGSPYGGVIRIFSKGTLVLVSDNKEQ